MTECSYNIRGVGGYESLKPNQFFFVAGFLILFHIIISNITARHHVEIYIIETFTTL